MKLTTFVRGEIIAVVVRDQVDNRAVRQRRRFVEEQASLLDARAERTHIHNCTAYSTVTQDGRS